LPLKQLKTRLTEPVLRKTPRGLSCCIAMHVRKNYQARFFAIRPEKGPGNGPAAAETR